MRLSELFPKKALITLQGNEYEVKITTRAALQLEHDYDSQEKIQQVFASALSNMKTSDLVNVLYAGLLHTKAFHTKEYLLDVMDVKDHSTYIDAIINACVNAAPLAEQLEKMEVIAATSKVKKNEPSEITGRNTPFIARSAALLKKNILTRLSASWSRFRSVMQK